MNLFLSYKVCDLMYISDVMTLFKNVRAARDMVVRQWTHQSIHNQEGRTEEGTDGKNIYSTSSLYLPRSDYQQSDK